MATPARHLLLLTLFVLVGLGACRRDEPAEEPLVAEPAAQLTPEQQMQTSLQRLVEAQAAHFDRHNRFADSIRVLMEDHDFVPVGDATVALTFVGTEPQWGYVASSVHPFSNQQCEVLHGRASDGLPFSGRIECEVQGASPPTPGTLAPAAPDTLPPADTGAADTLPPPG